MTERSVASPDLTELLAKSRPRAPAELDWHMRERIAAAIRCSQPSFLEWRPHEAKRLFSYETPERRAWFERWADAFLLCCDAVGLEVVDVADSHGERVREIK